MWVLFKGGTRKKTNPIVLWFQTSKICKNIYFKFGKLLTDGVKFSGSSGKVLGKCLILKEGARI